MRVCRALGQEWASETAAEQDEHGRFLPGNRAAQTHGSYSLVGVKGKAAELADHIRSLVPAYSEGDDILIALVASKLVAYRRALSELAKADEPNQRLESAALGWGNSISRDLERPGMSPTARARLGLDIARAGDAVDANLERLRKTGEAIREARELETHDEIRGDR